MFSNLSYIIKSGSKTIKCSKINKISRINVYNLITTHCFSKNAAPDVEVVDVNIDKIMDEDNKFVSNYGYEPSPEIITSRNLNGTPVAPIDVDPWIDEELEKGGTVDMEYIEKSKDVIHYPKYPKERTGFYEFEGIKIWLPKKMLSPSTYRYRLDEDEEETLPDDIRICKFNKFKPSSSN